MYSYVSWARPGLGGEEREAGQLSSLPVTTMPGISYRRIVIVTVQTSRHTGHLGGREHAHGDGGDVGDVDDYGDGGEW